MFIERSPRRVAEDFYAATQIPSSAFSADGKLLYSGGSHFIHDDYALYNDLVASMVSPEPDGPLSKTLTNAGGEAYTAYYINKYKYRDGFVLAGPYTREDLARISQFEVCFYNNQTPDPIGSRLLKTPVRGRAACYSLNIRRALDFIHAQYREELTLDGVVDHLGLNKSYFCTLFKKETGMTFTAYVNQVRIEKSKRHLMQGNRSVLDVALSVGFTSQNYFTVTFKRIMQMTPVQYRRQARI